MKVHEFAKHVGTGILLFAAAALLQFLARRMPGFASWYARTVYPALEEIAGRFFGLFPFSVVELELYLLILWLAISFLRIIMKKQGALRFAVRFVCLAGALAFLYTCGCGINYYAKPFSAYAGLTPGLYSAEELEQLCAYLTEQVNMAAADVTDAGEFRTDQKENESNLRNLFGQERAANNKRSWRKESVAAMRKLGESWPVLGGFYPEPKDILIDSILSWQQVTGVYSPFTIEANVNGAIPDYNLPHTMCHELSHLKGFMREDEANFIGYLACIGSDNDYFRYSGYLTAWVYAGNELARINIRRYTKLYDSLCSQAKTDLARNNEFWNRYEGRVAEVHETVNDVYLKANSQKDGVKSYGRMVDLMLAYYTGI